MKMLRKKIQKAIEEYHMIRRGDSLVIGVSGGADSVALFHALWEMREELQLRLKVVHVHHGLRGAEADSDALFVQKLCEKWNVDYSIFHFDVAKEAKKRGCGEEEAGRHLRYEAFRKELPIGGKIAVAHHQDDQAETVLMHLCRGSGLTGLCGMRPVHEDVIRPLLFCSRKEIETYCQEKGLAYCTDATNATPCYTRNKIRLELIPWLEKEVNVKTKEHISKTAQILTLEEDYLHTQAEQALAQARIFSEKKDECLLDISLLKRMHPAIRRRVLRQACFLLDGRMKDISYEHILALEALMEKQTGKKNSLPNGIGGVIQYENFRLFLNNIPNTQGFCYKMQPEETIFIKEVNKYVKLSFNAEKKERNFPSICTKQFDYDKIKDVLCCRSRQKGDKLSIGGGHEKKLKDFFIDEKIPASQRDSIPLIACKEEIIWVAGYRTSAKFHADNRTKNIVWISIWEENNEGKSGHPHYSNGH
jgi:tRNA(Ile)-lysidine synthase